MSTAMSKSPPEEAYRLRMTYEEFLAWANEDVHVEWVEGEVFVFMLPGTRHQSVVPAPIDSGIFRSRVLPGFWLKTKWLTAVEMPDPLPAFAEIVGLPEEVKQTLRRIAEQGPRIPE